MLFTLKAWKFVSDFKIPNTHCLRTWWQIYFPSVRLSVKQKPPNYMKIDSFLSNRNVILVLQLNGGIWSRNYQSTVTLWCIHICRVYFVPKDSNALSGSLSPVYRLRVKISCSTAHCLLLRSNSDLLQVQGLWFCKAPYIPMTVPLVRQINHSHSAHLLSAASA